MVHSFTKIYIHLVWSTKNADRSCTAMRDQQFVTIFLSTPQANESSFAVSICRSTTFMPRFPS